MRLRSEDTRTSEPPFDAPHWHVWIDRGKVLISQPARFPSRAAANNAALRSGLERGEFRVFACAEVIRRRPCRHAPVAVKRGEVAA